MLMKMKCLDGTGIAERRGNLRRFRRKGRGKALLHADHFEKIAAVVGPQVVWLDADAFNQIGGIGCTNYFADSGFTFWSRDADWGRCGSAHSFVRLTRT